MNKRILELARVSREVYIAKMRYQRLRMRELEMMKAVMGDELEETQGYLNQMDGQVGEIHEDLFGGLAESGSNAERWACLRLFPRFSQDSTQSSGGAYSARSSENGDSLAGHSLSF